MFEYSFHLNRICEVLSVVKRSKRHPPKNIISYPWGGGVRKFYLLLFFLSTTQAIPHNVMRNTLLQLIIQGKIEGK